MCQSVHFTVSFVISNVLLSVERFATPITAQRKVFGVAL